MEFVVFFLLIIDKGRTERCIKNSVILGGLRCIYNYDLLNLVDDHVREVTIVRYG